MAPLVGGWANGFGATTAAGGSNPFPDAVAGVYEVADAGDLTVKPANSVALVPAGDLWISVGPGVWPQLISPAVIANASALPVATGGVYFTTSCLVGDSGGNVWRGNGDVGWVRIVCAAVANVAALPEPVGDESFETDLLCLTLDLGIVYQWDGSAWGLP